MCGVLGLFKHKHKHIETLHYKMKKWLFWGAALRVIFESYLELTICITIGFLHMQWPSDDFAVAYNNIFAIVMAVIVIMMPLYSSVFYGWHIEDMDDAEFK